MESSEKAERNKNTSTGKTRAYNTFVKKKTTNYARRKEIKDMGSHIMYLSLL